MKILKTDWKSAHLHTTERADSPWALSRIMGLNFYRHNEFLSTAIFYRHDSMKILKTDWKSAHLHTTERADSPWALSGIMGLHFYQHTEFLSTHNEFLSTAIFYQHDWMKILKTDWKSAHLHTTERADSPWALFRIMGLNFYQHTEFLSTQRISINSYFLSTWLQTNYRKQAEKISLATESKNSGGSIMYSFQQKESIAGHRVLSIDCSKIKHITYFALLLLST